MSDKHECNCGAHGEGDCCGEDEFEVMTLTFENGEEAECAIIGVFNVEDKEYIALIPFDELEDEDAEVMLYGYSEVEGEEPELLTIESDEEYEKVSKAFDELMDSYEDEFEDEE